MLAGSGDDAVESELLIDNQPGPLMQNVNDCKADPTAGKGIQKEREEDIKSRQYEQMDKVLFADRTISSSRVSIDSHKSSSGKDGFRSAATLRGIEANIFNKNHTFDDHGLSAAESSMLHHNVFPRYGSSSREYGVSYDTNSISRLVEESAAMRRRYSLDVQSSVPSYYTSSWKSTLLQNSPFFSKSDSEKYKTTFTPYNWEPSVPFRSSFFIPPVNGSDVQYDPFRDIEQPERASLKHSSYGQTQDIQSVSGQNLLECDIRSQISAFDKSYSGHDKAVPAVEAESAANSASEAQNKSMTEEENPMVPGSIKALLKASRSNNEGKSKGQRDLKVDNGRLGNELDDEESKAIRCFRAALIEYVKELMRPIWHEGLLSKDVYKVIVQKAEDKILSTLQPTEVPNSTDSIKQYLSSSRSKIWKLIQVRLWIW